MQFDYFYEEEAEQYSFYRIPKAMFTDPQFTALSVESRVLYGLMLDRMSLSRKNQWVDEDSRVYIRFTVEDIMEQLNCGKAKAIKLMGELDEENGIGLIQKVRVGFGKPSIIYVKNFIARRIPSQHVMDNSEVQKSNFKKYENRTSRGTKIELHEVSKSNLKKYENRTSRSTKIEPYEVRKSNLMRYENQTSKSTKIEPYEVRKSNPNDMDYIQTDYSDNDSINLSANDGWKEWERIVKTNISYEILVNDCVESTALLDDIVEIMVETIAFARDFVMVGDVKYPYEFTKDKLLKLNQFHIMYVLSGLEEAAPKMTNPKAYLLKCLMNAPITMNSYYHTRVQHDMRNGMTS